MTTLTDRQRAILAAIPALTAFTGYPPTYSEIGNAVGLSSAATVMGHVHALTRAGLVVRQPGGSRCLALAPDVVVSRDGQIARVIPIAQTPGGDHA